MSVEAEGVLFGLLWTALGVAALALMLEHIDKMSPPDWWKPRH